MPGFNPASKGSNVNAHNRPSGCAAAPPKSYFPRSTLRVRHFTMLISVRQPPRQSLPEGRFHLEKRPVPSFTLTQIFPYATSHVAIVRTLVGPKETFSLFFPRDRRGISNRPTGIQRGHPKSRKRQQRRARSKPTEATTMSMTSSRPARKPESVPVQFITGKPRGILWAHATQVFFPHPPVEMSGTRLN